MTCPACGGRGYTVSEHSDEHGVYQDSYECEECRHYLSETCACCGHWHGAHHEDQDGVRMHCEAAGCRCPEYTTIEDVMIDKHVRRIAMRDAARVACRRLRLERDEARKDAASNRRRVELFGNALLGGLRTECGDAGVGAMTRDPRIDPHEGDELTQRDGALRLLVDGVLDGVVLYRVVDSQDGLLGASRIPLSEWREIAAEQCEGVADIDALQSWAQEYGAWP